MSTEPSTPEARPDPLAAPAARQWTRGDLAIGSALIVLLIALFLPWFSETTRVVGTVVMRGSATGLRAHGNPWVVLVLAIVAFAVLVARDAVSRLPGNLPSAEQLLVVTTGLALALTLLGAADKPGSIVSSPAAQVLHGWAAPVSQVSVSIGWSYGAFIAVLAAGTAFITSFGTAGPLQAVSRTAQPAQPAHPAGADG